MNRIGWFGVKARDLRDSQLKLHFHVGTVLERAPEFMRGSDKHDCPPPKNDAGSHVFMDGSQFMMGCQRFLPESETRKKETDAIEMGEDEMVEMPWHVDGGSVVEDGKKVSLAHSSTMKNLMHGMSLMVPIQERRFLRTRAPDGKGRTNEMERGDLGMFGHGVAHAGVHFGPKHPSLDGMWTVDLVSKAQMKVAATGTDLEELNAAERTMEQNPSMAPWNNEQVVACAGAMKDLAMGKMKKLEEEVRRRRGEDLENEFVGTIDDMIEELEAVKE